MQHLHKSSAGKRSHTHHEHEAGYIGERRKAWNLHIPPNTRRVSFNCRLSIILASALSTPVVYRIIRTHVMIKSTSTEGGRGGAAELSLPSYEIIVKEAILQNANVQRTSWAIYVRRRREAWSPWPTRVRKRLPLPQEDSPSSAGGHS